jgi:hypothetical protein
MPVCSVTSRRLAKFCRNARSTELRSAAPLTGLVKKSLAPSFIALTANGMSPRPVMKMIGAASFALKIRLQLNTRHARHANVSNQACGLLPGSGIEKLFCGVEAERRHPRRFDQIGHCKSEENPWTLIPDHKQTSGANHNDRLTKH